MKSNEQVLRVSGWMWLLILFVPLLSACGTEVARTISFYKEGAWEADMSLGVPSEVAALAGAFGDFESQLNELINEAESLGVTANLESSRRDDIFIYTLHFEGETLDTLQSLLLPSGTTIEVQMVDGERYIHYSETIGGDLLGAGRNTLTLNGGDVISGNGQEIRRGTLQWVNPSGQIEAILTEKSRFNSVILLGIMGLLVIVGGVMALRGRSRRQEGPCVQCGTWLESGARFCYTCGEKR